MVDWRRRGPCKTVVRSGLTDRPPWPTEWDGHVNAPVPAPFSPATSPERLTPVMVGAPKPGHFGSNCCGPR
jgi:hypothetical protein